MEREVAFTPGPWEAYLESGIISQGGNQIASAWVPRHRNDPIRERAANANLMAAAPDLYTAAEKVLAGLNARIDAACASGGKSVPVFLGIAELSDALRKARGETATTGRV